MPKHEDLAKGIRTLHMGAIDAIETAKQKITASKCGAAVIFLLSAQRSLSEAQGRLDVVGGGAETLWDRQSDMMRKFLVVRDALLRGCFTPHDFGEAGLAGLARLASFVPKPGCARVVAPKGKFDPRSFRWVKSGKAAVLVGCPKGKWDADEGACRVGTRAHLVVAPARGKRCKPGEKRR